MKTENTFIVYLGAIDLTPEQHQKINAAIHEAVSTKLVHLAQDERIALILNHKWKKGPVSDDITAQLANEVLIAQMLCS